MKNPSGETWNGVVLSCGPCFSLRLKSNEGKVRRKLEPEYIRGFLIEALISAMPLKEATKYVDALLPSIGREQDSSVKEWNDYDIKVAFAKVAMRNI